MAIKDFRYLLQSHGRAKILIMEYCAGGSVYKMLEDPANMHGLLEDEFLVFLRDISTSFLMLFVAVVYLLNIIIIFIGTVSKLWPSIGQIFAIDRQVLHFNALAGGDPLRISG